MNAPNGTKRARRDRHLIASKVVVGSWWIMRPYMALSKKSYTGARRIMSIEQSSLGPMVRWEPYGRWTKGGKLLTLQALLNNYDPCDPPAPVAPAPAVTHEPPAPSLRAIVREEVRAALADFAAELRPAMRQEALAAVKAAFGEVVS